MRKIIYIMSVFFILFSSCNISGANSNEEIITIALPQWPPKGAQNNYPPLSRWKITIKSADYSTTFFQSPASSLTIKATKNIPLSVTATPVTKTTSHKEIIFFKPAGYLYPYCQENSLTWNNGFAASLMQSLYQADASGGAKVNTFLPTFNWVKLIEILEGKITNEQELYNPWLLNKETILNKIATKKFTSTYLNLSSTYVLDKTALGKLTTNSGEVKGPLGVKTKKVPEEPLSSFIPLNTAPQLLLKKYEPQQFMTSPDTAATITYNSTKNVSLEYSFLPILIQGYETN